MSSYNHEVPNFDIANRINKLTVRINQDPQITPVLSSITFLDPILTVTFGSALSDYELIIVGAMVKAIFLDEIAGETYEFINVVSIPRNIDKLAYVPVVTDDIDSGYNSGSTIYDPTTPALYVCTDNTEGAAVWVRCDNLPTNVCTAGSTTTAAVPTTLTAVDPTTIIFSTPVSNWAFDGSGRLTTNTTGIYRITYNIQIAVSALTTIGAYISINGTGSVAGSERTVQIASGIGLLNNEVTYTNLTAGDYIQIMVSADLALATYSTTTINAVTNYSIMLSLEQV